MGKMYSIKNKIGFWSFLFLAVFACQKNEDTSQVVEKKSPTPYQLVYPKLFPEPIIPPGNPMTKEGVELGKSLYADPILSSNGLSCSSCHLQEKSFSSPLFVSSKGYQISVPPHVNLAFKKFYNWTGSETYLDTLCVADFGPEFFNTDSNVLAERLATHPYYSKQFKSAFGIDNPSKLSYSELKKNIAYAITQYMRTLISFQSKYDQYKTSAGNLTEVEYGGMLIFFSEKGDCFHCHSPWLFSDGDFHNNGLNEVFNGFDKGRELVTCLEFDKGKFLTPTLRNIAQTAPYMHDGRFKTLEDVVDFYNEGVKESATLDPIMYKRKDIHRLGLNQIEKMQLVAFLKTLTDESFLNQE